jgi:hypothetical protein
MRLADVRMTFYILALAVYLPLAAAAQDAMKPARWTEVFPSSAAPSERPDPSGFTAVPGYSVCNVLSVADSLVLTTPTPRLGPTIGWVYREAGWQGFTMPSGEDTITVSLVGGWCRLDPVPSLLIERGGTYALLGPFALLQIGSASTSEPLSTTFVTARERRELAPVYFFGDKADAGKLVTPLGLRAFWAKVEREHTAKMNADIKEEMAARRAKIRRYGWPRRFENAVAARDIIIGMDAEMVVESWGLPVSINKTLTAAGETQQWVYGLGDYVYFSPNALVSAVQTSR